MRKCWSIGSIFYEAEADRYPSGYLIRKGTLIEVPCGSPEEASKKALSRAKEISDNNSEIIGERHARRIPCY